MKKIPLVLNKNSIIRYNQSKKGKVQEEHLNII